MATVTSPQTPVATAVPVDAPPKTVTVYSHSPIFYWWPVWLMGYILALLTYIQGVETPFGDIHVMIHPNPVLGVMFTFVFLLVILMTHIAVRGLASVTVIITLIAAAFLFGWMGWWEAIMRALGSLAIYMNLGFYLFFSSAVFLVWCLAIFVFDHTKWWTFRPGQMIYETALGTGQQTYDTRGMAVQKLRDDLFRHWILGLGSGDIHITTTGARKEEFVIPNVLFVGAKLDHIQRLASMHPETSEATAPAPQAAPPTM